jgi:RNA polymerase sporulation-specific sigma factor
VGEKMAKHKVEITGIKTTNIKVLKNDETVNLIEEYKNNQNSFILEKIIMGNMKLVLSVIKNFSSRCDNQDDLFQIGCIGLIKAINNFEIQYNLKFSTYAVPMIIGEIKRYLRDNTPVRISRQIKDLAYKSLKAKEEYIKMNNEEPSDEKLASILNVDACDIQEALNSTQSVVSLYDTVYGEGEESIFIIDQLKDESQSEEKTVNYITLKDALKKLNKSQKDIIIDRYYLGKTQFEIASEFNISQAQVSRIEKSAIETLKSFFY